MENVTGFKWNKFGKLTGTYEARGRLYIVNESGEERQISIPKYRAMIPNLKKKICKNRTLMFEVRILKIYQNSMIFVTLIFE